MKYQLFEDMKTTIRLNPNAPHILKIAAVNKPLDVAVQYDGDEMMRIIIFKYDTREVVKKSPWTNSYKVLSDYVKVNKIELAEYRG